MEPAVYRSTARRRDSRHGTAITPFSAWQGGACSWRVGVLKADGTLDDLYGVTAIILRISSYGGTSPGAFSWVERTVPAADFTTPTSAAAVQAGTEWHAEVQLTEEETLLPVEDSGARPYWWEWRAVTPAGEVPLSAGQVIVRGNSGKAGVYALSADVAGESAAREAAVSNEANARIAADATEATARAEADTAEAAARSAADTAEATARANADSALAGQIADVAAGYDGVVSDLDALDTEVGGKASKDLTDALSDSVLNRHLANGIVTANKLDASVLASMGGNLDPALNQGPWNAATNTPTIPAAAGNTGKHYYVNVAGTASGNAAGTYSIGDKIWSNGTAWLKIANPPTNIPDNSLPLIKIEDTETSSEPFIANDNGVLKNVVWAQYGEDAEGNKLIQIGVTEDGVVLPDSTAGVRFVVHPDGYLETDDGLVELLWGIASEDGTVVHIAIDANGKVYIPSLSANLEAVDALTIRVTALEAAQESTNSRLTAAEAAITELQEGGGTGELSDRVDAVETEQAIISVRMDEVEASQADVTERTDEMEAALAGKADADLANVPSNSVLNRHLIDGAVTQYKLSEDILAALLGGLDPLKFVAGWIPATNTPAIPSAAGNTGKWYHVNADGAAAGNAAGTYERGDRVVSNGTTWERQAAPLLSLADGSIPPQKLQYNLVGDYTIDIDGVPTLLRWGIVSEDGTALHIGVDSNGQVYIPSLGLPGYIAPDYLMHPQDGGGAATTGRNDAGADTVEIIGGDGEWSDFQHVKGDIWIARTEGVAGLGMQRVNAITGRFIPLDQSVLMGTAAAGQSLTQGQLATPVISVLSKHPGRSLMFNAGARAGCSNGGATPISLDGSTLTSFVDYVEAVNSTMHESPWSACLNRFHSRNLEELGTSVRTHFSNHGLGGGAYSAIKKGTIPYANGITELTKAMEIATAAGMRYVYGATFFVHGESNEGGRTPAATYQANIQEYATDISADAKAITGQEWEPLFIMSQCNQWCAYGFQTPTASLGQLPAMLANPNIIIACPKYQFEYSDNVHLKGPDSYRLGEYCAKALEWQIVNKRRWLPLYPVSAVQNSGDITITFHVPVGVLAFDSVLVTDPGNYGFELAGATISGTPAIVGNTVVIPKTGTATAARYAYTSFGTTPGTPSKSGRTTGPRGCLRDTDPAVSMRDGANLYNWSLMFSIDL